jgi:putative acetyltransferase
MSVRCIISMTRHIEIRSETSADVEKIEELTTTAFLHARHTSHTEQYVVNAWRRGRHEAG